MLNCVSITEKRDELEVNDVVWFITRVVIVPFRAWTRGCIACEICDDTEGMQRRNKFSETC